MASTAIGAAGEDARTITFMNKEHKEFYLEYLPKCRWKDVYHKALVYCLGIDRDTRKHVNRIYDFKNGSVKPECLQEGWQTSGSVRVVRMAFNLYCNGTPSVYDYEDAEKQLSECSCYTVEDLFCCGYGLMLDRMALSIRNNWVDNEGKVYIIFTLEQVMEYMNCGKDKGVKILAELDTDKGIGLIERVKRGLGKPTIIYVKSFVYRKEKVLDSAENDNRSQEVGKAEVKSSEKPKSGVLESRSQEFGKTEVWKSEKSKSRVRKNRSTEVGKTDPNNTNYNYTDISNTDRSNTDLINLSDSSEQQSMDLMEEMGLFQMNTALVKRNIEYDCLVQRCRLGEQQQLDEIVALIVETISIERENITISGVKYPYQFVKSRLLLLEESHIEYVLDCLHENTREVKNIKAYLLTCLMNTLNLKQTEQRDAYIDGLAFGIRTISEAFLHENKNRIW